MKNTLTLFFLLVLASSFGQKINLKTDNPLLLQLSMNGTIDDDSPLKIQTFSLNLIAAPDKNNNKNGALSFENNGSIQIENSAEFRNMQTFSLCSWIYLTSFSSHGNIFSKASPGRDFNLQIIETGQVNFHFYDEYYYHWYSKTKLDLNKWYHIALVFNKNTVELFINGKMAETNTFFPDTYNKRTPFYKKIKWEGNEFFIGNLNQSSYEFFPGYLDDVRLYEKALTAKEITSLILSKDSEKNKKYPLNFTYKEIEIIQGPKENVYESIEMNPPAKNR